MVRSKIRLKNRRWKLATQPRKKFINSMQCVCSLLAGGYWGFHCGKPVPFANRAPSWIFEPCAPGYERASAKIDGEGSGREGKPPSLISRLPPYSPRVAFLPTTACPAPPRRVLSKMAATKSEHRVFSPKKLKLQRLQVGYVCEAK